jgi:hypothetical protein
MSDLIKLARVVVERLEEKPPGEGVPAGWLPDTIYHVNATDIPYRVERPEYTISLRPKGHYLLRCLAVAPMCVDDWELSVRIGMLLVQPRTSCRLFGEDPCWPEASKPLHVEKGIDVVLTLWRRTLSVSKHFECVLKGAETSVLPKGEEHSIMDKVYVNGAKKP